MSTAPPLSRLSSSWLTPLTLCTCSVSRICTFRRHHRMKARTRTIVGGIFISSFLMCLYAYHNPANMQHLLQQFAMVQPQTSNLESLLESTCPDVSRGMMRGQWRGRPLTQEEETEIDNFLTLARSHHRIPSTLERKDKRCGTVTFPTLRYFRALCNPKGPTPCCHHGTCVSKTPDECRCPDCYDMRNTFHAEYSIWESHDARCSVKNFTAAMACGLLSGNYLTLVGDSLMRQLHTALLLILNNDREKGALKPGTAEGCGGMLTFTEKECRLRITKDTRVCNGSVHVNMSEDYKLTYTNRFHRHFDILLHKPNTVMLVGIGYHDSFDPVRTYNEFILPVIVRKEKEKARWPLLIWATNHQFGLLKTPLIPQQANGNIRVFNKYMMEKLRQHNVPIFDTYNMTSNVVSQDGSHYGLGLNVMKAQMFLNFLLELKNKNLW